MAVRLYDEAVQPQLGLPVNQPIAGQPLSGSPALTQRLEASRGWNQPIIPAPTVVQPPVWYTQNGPVMPAQMQQTVTPAPAMADTTNGWPMLPANASPAEVDNYIRTYYGYMAAFMAIPEVANVLRTAAKSGFDQYRLFGAISATTWWKTTDANARQWLTLSSQDPAEANRLRQQKGGSIRDNAGRLGVNLSGTALSQLTEDSLRYGWNDSQVLDAILGHAEFRAGQMQGMLGANIDNVKAMSAQYGMLMADKTAYDWAMRVLNESLTPEGIETSLRRQAKARYSYMADLIDQGVTVMDYFEPIRSTIANELELSPDEVNLLDQRYLAMMEVRDPQTGQLRGATTSEAQKAARRDYRWKDTRAAGEMAAGMVSLLDRAMGVR